MNIYLFMLLVDVGIHEQNVMWFRCSKKNCLLLLFIYFLFCFKVSICSNGRALGYVMLFVLECFFSFTIISLEDLYYSLFSAVITLCNF